MLMKNKCPWIIAASLQPWIIRWCLLIKRNGMMRYILWLLCLPALTACDNDENSKKADPTLVYFLVAERTIDKGEQYILPLKDVEDIQAARDLIENGEEMIVMA